ncbi:hypothetical protein, partial [Escherichia coli]|uniref:hypothetical protein n=1 Tax=Escherichia coli TaxID=562 RepID=UPI001C5B2502
GKNSLNRLIRCVCGKKIGPDPRNFNQRVSLGRNDLLIRTFLSDNLCQLIHCLLLITFAHHGNSSFCICLEKFTATNYH